MFEPQPERLVSAAIRKNDFIIMGVRHFDRIMQEQLDAADFDRKGWEQGFITNKLRFVTREDAWVIAQANDQICRGKDRDPGKLFSEDLY